MKKKDKKQMGDIITHLLVVVKVKKLQRLPTLSCVFSTLGRERNLRDDAATSFFVCLTMGVKSNWVMQL
jgi:hypothetical protein